MDCTCKDEVTKDSNFCCCFPARCGFIFIGLFICILLVCYWFFTLSDYMNEYFDWWYVTIMLALYIPLFVAVILFFNFFFCKKEQESHRKKLVLACWLAVISLALTMIWTLVYICTLYKYEFVYTGSRPWNEDQYIKQSKKNYAVITIVIGMVLILTILYMLFFIMAVNKKYAEYYGDEGEDEEEKEPMMKEDAEDKPDEMMAAE